VDANNNVLESSSKLVTEEMEATTLRERGMLKVLRVEAGPLILLGLGLTAVGVVHQVAPLGAAGWMVLALALFEGIALLQLSMWLDRVEVKPVWLLIRCALWGAGPAVLAAGVLNHMLAQAIGVRAVAMFGAPLVEEGMKGLALVWLLKHRRDQVHDALDAAMYAICVGIAFATIENVGYYVKGLQHGSQVLVLTVLARGLLSPFAHPLFTFFTAMGIAAAANRSSPGIVGYPLLGYVCAVSAHALWNTFPPTAFFVIPGFIALATSVYQNSRREEETLTRAVAAATARGELPPHAVELLGACRRPRFIEWSAAAVDPDHPLYERWRRHHLALIMASDSVASQLAANDELGAVTASQVQSAARELLRDRLTMSATEAERRLARAAA
jgi:RsiW-degrading membrane proteinase PrsW (M82 family)